MKRQKKGKRADSVVVLDFETSGLSPAMGDRPIEIGAVRVIKGRVVEKFQKLMNPGFRINSFIEEYTGIKNRELKTARPCEEVIEQFSEFIKDDNLVAHNASFDKKFLDSEFNRIDKKYVGEFACSMLSARRIYPQAPNHKLESLASFNNLKTDGVFHRALADSEMTAKLWLKMINDITDAYEIPQVTFQLMKQISRKPKHTIPSFLKEKAVQ